MGIPAMKRLHDYSYVEQIWNVIPDSYVNIVMRNMNKILQEKFELKNLHEIIYSEPGKYKTNLMEQLNEMSTAIAERLNYAVGYEDMDKYRLQKSIIEYTKTLLAGIPEKQLI